MTYYGPDGLREWAMAFWYPEQWLDETWTKKKQGVFDTLYDFNLLGMQPFRTQFDNILDARDRESYMRWNQLTYGDVKDPRKLPGNGAIVRSSQLNFVSSNIKRLYR